MPEYGFSLTHMFLYKDRVYDYFLIREDTGQRKPIVCNILRSESLTSRNASEQLVSNEKIDVLLTFSDFPGSFPY